MMLTIGGNGCAAVERTRFQQIATATNCHIVLEKFAEQLHSEEDLSLDFYYPTVVAYSTKLARFVSVRVCTGVIQ